MATLLKVLNNLADIKSAAGVALRVRTQGAHRSSPLQDSKSSDFLSAATAHWSTRSPTCPTKSGACGCPLGCVRPAPRATCWRSKKESILRLEPRAQSGSRVNRRDGATHRFDSATRGPECESANASTEHVLHKSLALRRMTFAK